MSTTPELETKILNFLAAKTPPIQSVEDKDHFLSLADEGTLAATLYPLQFVEKGSCYQWRHVWR